MSYGDTTITVRNRQVRLLRGGRGQPLLYLHDTFCPTWGPLHDHLAEHYDVLFPIHPGCVGSTGLDDMNTMEDLVFHLLDLCTALQVTRPILLGASFGGWLAAEWAIRYATMLRGIILVDALGLHVPDAPATDLWRLDPAQTRHALFADPQAALAHALVPDVPTPDVLPGMLQARLVLARFAWQFPDNPRLARYLYRITVPTLVVWGEHDGVISTAHGRAYRDGITGAELVVLPQSGHLPHVECPTAFRDAILDYLARL